MSNYPVGVPITINEIKYYKEKIKALKKELKIINKKCIDYQRDAMYFNDRYFELYNRDYREIDEILEYLESRKLDLQEAMSEQKGDKNLLLAAYDGAHGMVVEILDFINDKQE